MQAASLIGKAFSDKGHRVVISPLADGGEGTVEAILSAVGGTKKTSSVQDPLGRLITASWGLIDKEDCPQTAVIEMAAASGLHLLGANEHNPLKTSTFGTGQLIKAALDEKTNKIIVGVGGSATNDGGMGAAAALGAKFVDSHGKELEPVGKNLGRVSDIDLSDLDKRIGGTEILVAVDVQNPFYGPQGAAFVYGPQKGADPAQIKTLDNGLRNFAAVVKQRIGLDLQQIEGAGAAGGLAGGLTAFLGAKIVPGTQFICKMLRLADKVKEADLVVGGEGRVDEQTLYGKAPTGVVNLARKYGKPIVLIAGQLGPGYQKVEEIGVKIFALAKSDAEVEQCLRNPKPAIERAVKEIIGQ